MKIKRQNPTTQHPCTSHKLDFTQTHHFAPTREKAREDTLAPTMIAGIRLWMSLAILCVGSAIVSFQQMNYLSGFLPSLGGDAAYEPSVDTADFREPKDGTIKSISLLGERNSGTRWIYG
jgi:hypothetical protein